MRDLKVLEDRTGRTLLPPGYTYTKENRLPLLEAISPIARAAVIGETRGGLLPDTVRQWIEMNAASSPAPSAVPATSARM